ncbi:hypothetical protein B1C78_09030 [Thioalkalivibrio denitrificans]|uniref:Type I restriction modification DNA specificity domain-containing protein n=1 Tax=Thioalkalivibrio denitrificans TaxID=108003 RepID=A0A1V3NH90_9GAMM|nr:restriction endonuclease subunit S [Thioalkalivibrio denitrificans]OOG24344.1 hypothetical protein B1C78_09030 [Thioalkalivibrio denitrificans]
MGSEFRETPYGAFAADFVVDQLANLCDSVAGIQTGPFGSQLHQKDYVPKGTPIITVEHLGENRILHSELPMVSDADRDRLSRYLLREGDIVFSRVGSVDRRALVRGEENGWMFSGRCLRVRPDPAKIDSSYLSYFFGLPAFRDHIRAIAVGATMPSLNTSLLSSVIVPHPPDIDEQRAIAHILGTLDDKIELNRRRNQTLEAMVRALFKDWFVDIGPVRAKMEGRKPYLPADLWQLFPERLDEAGKPEGWEFLSFGRLIEGTIGGDWGKEQPEDGHDQAICIIRGTDIPDLASGSTGKVPTRFTTKKKLISRMLQDGDIVVEVSGGSSTQPTGRSLRVSNSMLDRFPHPVVCASFCRRFRPKSASLGILAACHMTNLYREGGTWEYQNQSTGISNFQTAHFLEAESVLVPGEDVLNAFVAFVEPIMGKVANNENIDLAKVRDTLLPKLISGELRIRDAEKLLKRADMNVKEVV